MREAHEIIASRVGQRLKDLRAGLTQAEFSARLGVTQTQYHRYESGKRLAPDRLLQAVAELMGLTPEQVIWGDQLPPPAPAPPQLSPPDPLGQAVTHLVTLLDRQSLEDLYYFLKRKAEDMAARQRKETKQALAALETLRKAAM
jgi:transcriptional regulator with XRE-family HTH domain